MAQGKLQVKATLPNPGKSKTKGGRINTNKKGQPTQRRGNAPAPPKKTKSQEQSKLKKLISQSVDKAMEQELRRRALGGKQSLTKKKPAQPKPTQPKPAQRKPTQPKSTKPKRITITISN